MHSAGAGFDLSGTIGQPDAGAMSGGTFELSGGFWFALVPGDCIDDGGVRLSDHGTFRTCLSGPGAPGMRSVAFFQTGFAKTTLRGRKVRKSFAFPPSRRIHAARWGKDAGRLAKRVQPASAGGVNAALGTCGDGFAPGIGLNPPW